MMQAGKHLPWLASALSQRSATPMMAAAQHACAQPSSSAWASDQSITAEPRSCGCRDCMPAHISHAASSSAAPATSTLAATFTARPAASRSWVRSFASSTETDPVLVAGSSGPEAEANWAAWRAKNNFRRCADGRVQLIAKNGCVWDIKVDMRVAGAVLMRRMLPHEGGPAPPPAAPPASDSKEGKQEEDEEGGGGVFYIVSDDLQQVDLSSDHVVQQLFSNGNWEGVKAGLLTRVQPNPSDPKQKDAKEPNKPPQFTTVKLSRGQFLQLVTILQEQE
uniref:Uncharacterized protein n=1 Tax=Chlamydomonas leiostraca TaxID=1034604 RepID=A0A7S0R8I2_9CHLO|mmetsp:Transcript_1653/g.4394  ORF Transcript_1653/g.4394 Transcript_1653/m.4394 type:complete len:278 (+) Transcript_1653:117-950(+)